jgi:hypothetical protein
MLLGLRSLWEPSGGSTYTLTASGGSFTETGEPANLLFARKIAVAQGSFTETGEPANLLFGRKLAIGQGSFTEAGQSVNLLRGRKVAIGQGSFTETGEAVTFQKGHTALSAAQGSFTFTGEAVTLTFSGQAIAQVRGAGIGRWFLDRMRPKPKPIVLRHFTFAPNPAYFGALGQRTNLLYQRRMSAPYRFNVGIRGQSVKMNHGRFKMKAGRVQVHAFGQPIEMEEGLCFSDEEIMAILADF